MNYQANEFVGAGATNFKDWFAFIGRKVTLNIPGYSYGDCPSALVCSSSAPTQPHKKGSCLVRIGSLKFIQAAKVFIPIAIAVDVPYMLIMFLTNVLIEIDINAGFSDLGKSETRHFGTKINEDLGGCVACDGAVSTHVFTCCRVWVISPAWLKEIFQASLFVVLRARAKPGTLFKGFEVCLAAHMQPLDCIVRSANGNIRRLNIVIHNELLLIDYIPELLIFGTRNGDEFERERHSGLLDVARAWRKTSSMCGRKKVVGTSRCKIELLQSIRTRHNWSDKATGLFD
nr:hypothetical protein [Tanacetum cinerariifolium]